MTFGSGRSVEILARRDTAEYQLICFPHAGGSASFYSGWSAVLPELECAVVHYPGRGRRISEPTPTDLRAFALDIATDLIAVADRPLVLFGHSMGAPIALEVARQLEPAGVVVAHLFASGSRDAPCEQGLAAHSDEDPDVVMDQLVRLGGTDPELAADPDFRSLVLPYIQGDGRMFRSYAMADTPILSCPVTTIVGDRDTDADRRPWSSLTSGRFAEHQLPGDHFYLVEQPPFDLLRTVLAGATR